VHVADFDTARLHDNDNVMTFQGKLVGSPAYMAPELFSGAEFTDKSDVYSIAILLNELMVRVVTGEHQRPYTGVTVPNLLGGMGVLVYASGGDNNRPVVPPNSPQTFVDLVRKCWTGDASKRLSCAQLLASLPAVLRDLGANKSLWIDDANRGAI